MGSMNHLGPNLQGSNNAPASNSAAPTQAPSNLQLYDAAVPAADRATAAWQDWAVRMNNFTSRIGPEGHETAIYDSEPPSPPEPMPKGVTVGEDALKAGAVAALTLGANALFEGAPAIARAILGLGTGAANSTADEAIKRDWNIWQAWQLYNSVVSRNNGLRLGEALNGVNYKHDFD